jgi:hypothetical protein
MLVPLPRSRHRPAPGLPAPSRGDPHAAADLWGDPSNPDQAATTNLRVAGRRASSATAAGWGVPTLPGAVTWCCPSTPPRCRCKAINPGALAGLNAPRYMWMRRFSHGATMCWHPACLVGWRPLPGWVAAAGTLVLGRVAPAAGDCHCLPGQPHGPAVRGARRARPGLLHGSGALGACQQVAARARWPPVLHVRARVRVGHVQRLQGRACSVARWSALAGVAWRGREAVLRGSRLGMSIMAAAGVDGVACGCMLHAWKGRAVGQAPMRRAVGCAPVPSVVPQPRSCRVPSRQDSAGLPMGAGARAWHASVGTRVHPAAGASLGASLAAPAPGRARARGYPAGQPNGGVQLPPPAPAAPQLLIRRRIPPRTWRTAARASEFRRAASPGLHPGHSQPQVIPACLRRDQGLPASVRPEGQRRGKPRWSLPGAQSGRMRRKQRCQALVEAASGGPAQPRSPQGGRRAGSSGLGSMGRNPAATAQRAAHRPQPSAHTRLGAATRGCLHLGPCARVQQGPWVLGWPHHDTP